jgi:hypothetical protein
LKHRQDNGAQLTKGSSGNFPDYEVVDPLIMMTQQIADGRDLVPRLIWMLCLPSNGYVPARLVDATLECHAELEVAAILLELDAGYHLGGPVDGIQNVAQTNDLRALDHSEYLDGLGLNPRPQQRVKAVTRRKISRSLENLR